MLPPFEYLSPYRLVSGISLPNVSKLRSTMENVVHTASEAIDAIRFKPFKKVPPVNLHEDPENLYLTVEIPGVSPEDVELTYSENTLRIKGEKTDDCPEEAAYHHRERMVGMFDRTITLPVKVDPEGIKASAANGILKISMPKAPEAIVRRIIIEDDEAGRNE